MERRPVVAVAVVVVVYLLAVALAAAAAWLVAAEVDSCCPLQLLPRSPGHVRRPSGAAAAVAVALDTPVAAAG